MTATTHRPPWWHTVASLGILILGAVATAGAQNGGFEAVATIAGPADLVAIDDGHAYVTHHTTLTVYDLADPAAPRRVGELALPEEIWGFRIADDRIYLGANFTGLVIADISDPADPQVLGTYKSLGQTKIGAVYETKVALIDHMEGFVLVDATTESEPASAGSFFLDGYARDVVTSGPIAYATDSPTGLYVFDLSQEGMPEPIAVLHAPSAPRSSLGGDDPLERHAAAGRGGWRQSAAVRRLGSDDSRQILELRHARHGERRLPAGRSRVRGGRRRRPPGVRYLTTPSAPAQAGAFATARPARAVAATDEGRPARHRRLRAGGRRPRGGRAETRSLKPVALRPTRARLENEPGPRHPTDQHLTPSKRRYR